MRWSSYACPRCGGELYADYAQGSLSCLRCGHRDHPPAAPRARPPLQETDSSRSQRPLTSATGPALFVGLVQVSHESRWLIEGECATHGYQVVSGGCWRSLGAEDGPDLLVVEADRGGLAVSTARDLRAHFPSACMAVILTFWCEVEGEARAAVEFVLHAPLRRTEVVGVLRLLEHYGGWLPAPLLASKYRSGMDEWTPRLPPVEKAGSEAMPVSENAPFHRKATRGNVIQSP